MSWNDIKTFYNDVIAGNKGNIILVRVFLAILAFITLVIAYKVVNNEPVKLGPIELNASKIKHDTLIIHDTVYIPNYIYVSPPETQKSTSRFKPNIVTNNQKGRQTANQINVTSHDQKGGQTAGQINN